MVGYGRCCDIENFVRVFNGGHNFFVSRTISEDFFEINVFKVVCIFLFVKILGFFV